MQAFERRDVATETNKETEQGDVAKGEPEVLVHGLLYGDLGHWRKGQEEEKQKAKA